MDDLSPVSVQRLNFDQLPSETTDPIPENSVFGVPVAQLVPQSVFSWLDGARANNAQNDLNCPSRKNESQSMLLHGSTDSNNIITRKVCLSIQSVDSLD